MNYKFKTKPYAHQMTALEKSWNRETYAYFMEMGTGKTKVLIDNLAMLYDKGKINGALIVAPKGVVGTWYNNELPTHLPNHIAHVTTLWQSHITKTQREKLESLFEVEMHRSLAHINMCKSLSDEKKSFIIMDEIFSSTNPVEGISGAYAIAKKMASFENSVCLDVDHKFRVLFQSLAVGMCA